MVPPMVDFRGMTIVRDGDIHIGGVYTVIVCAALYLPQKLMTVAEFRDASFILQATIERLGLAPLIIDKIEPYMSLALFLLCGLIML